VTNDDYHFKGLAFLIQYQSAGTENLPNLSNDSDAVDEFIYRGCSYNFLVMAGSMMHSDTKDVSTVSSSLMQNDVTARQSRTKVTVAFTEANERVRTSIDSTFDGQTVTRKSVMIPLLRRGSRKQTLSLNPEEREALENLIEEVIMDGMGDGVVDSDGSSSDSDDRADEIFDKDSPTAGDGSTGNHSSKVSNPGSTTASVGGKKYYPGQLKVALKHMTNLPPRFVRKLAKAQQYLDASSADDLARPTATIVGSIEEEEEGMTAPHGKDEVLPVSNPAYSPGSSATQGDRDKDKTKIKETKLQEAKKQIRTLLCDKDQYVDEKSAIVGNNVVANVEVETTVGDNAVSVNCASSRMAADKKNDDFVQSVETPLKQQLSGVSKFASSRVAATVLGPDAVFSAVSHISQAHTFAATPISYMQANATAPTLSANVPDFVPKGSTSLPVSYNAASGHGTSFVRFTRDTGPMSPVQLDAFTRMVPTSVSALDPRYYVQPTVVQGQSASFYGIPQLYNTPPPSTGMPSRIMGEMLPSASCLVESAGVNGVGLNQSGSYSIPGQYNVPAYTSVYTPPFLENAPQAGVYQTYGVSSQSKPIPYQMTGNTYCSVSSGNVAGIGSDYQYGMAQPNSVGSYPCNTVSFVPFNGAVQGRNSHVRMSTPRAAGSVDFSRKSQGVHSRYSSGVTSAATFGRPGPHRFSHVGVAASSRMTPTKNVSSVLSPVVRFGNQTSESLRFAVAATRLPTAVSSTQISSYDNAVMNQQMTKHQLVDCVDVSSPAAAVVSQLASAPTSYLQGSDNLQADCVKTSQRFTAKSRKSLENALLCDMSAISNASNNSSRDLDVSVGGTTNRIQIQQFPALIFSSNCSTSDTHETDTHEMMIQTIIADAKNSTGTMQKDKRVEDVVAAPLSSVDKQVPVSIETGLIVDEIITVSVNKTDLPVSISDCLELREPLHSGQNPILELGDDVIALQSETVVLALRDDKTASDEATPSACEGIDLRADEQVEIDCSSEKHDGNVDNVSDDSAVDLVKSNATLHEPSEACGSSTTGASFSNDTNYHCYSADQADIALSDDVSCCGDNRENVDHLALPVRERLAVSLSCDFVKHLAHMFGNQDGQTPCGGIPISCV